MLSAGKLKMTNPAKSAQAAASMTVATLSRVDSTDTISATWM